MNTKLMITILAFPMILAGCREKQGTSGTPDQDAGMQTIAKTITYDVIVKNPNPLDTWTDECLKDLDLQRFINSIFEDVYSGSIKPRDYHSGEFLSIDDIRMLEQDFERSRIGKVQFVEEWLVAKDPLRVVKRIKSVMMAYELYEEDGSVRGYKAGFVAPLNP